MAGERYGREKVPARLLRPSRWKDSCRRLAAGSYCENATVASHHTQASPWRPTRSQWRPMATAPDPPTSPTPCERLLPLLEHSAAGGQRPSLQHTPAGMPANACSTGRVAYASEQEAAIVRNTLAVDPEVSWRVVRRTPPTGAGERAICWQGPSLQGCWSCGVQQCMAAQLFRPMSPAAAAAGAGV